jgi:hypothetical protein
MGQPKPEFDTTKWFRNQYIKEAGLEDETKSTELANLILQSIDKVDENLSYRDLAKSIAIILKNEYGTHNFKPFINELEQNLI